MKLLVLLLVLLALQSRADDDSIMGIISKLVSKMEEKYPSGDALAGQIEEFKAHEESDSERHSSLQEQVSGQASEIENFKQSLEAVQQEAAANTKQVEDNLQTQINDLTSEKEDMREQLDEYKIKLANLESFSDVSANSHLWVIDNYNWNKRNRKKFTGPSFYSSSLGAGEFGYKLEVYAKFIVPKDNAGNHLSLYFRLLRGAYDDILHWPFPSNVRFELLPQKTDVSVHHSNTTSISDEQRASDMEVFGRPTTSRGNLGWGFPKFIMENELEDNYLVHNKIYVKVTVV